MNLTAEELTAYLDDREAKGFTALLTYVTNPTAYYAGSSAPYAKALGGRAAGIAALPFTRSVRGGEWNGGGDDASFASPNDTYFAWVARFVDDAATRGMVVMLEPVYLGFNMGATDGWWRTINNDGNTRDVCHEFGRYLAIGHGPFTGFRDRPNIIWVDGGDMMPPNGSEGALRALAVLHGLRDGGDSHLHTAHWQHDYLTNEQTDFAPYMDLYAAYTHGPYGSVDIGPTYGETRVLYETTPTKPVFLIETTYWGDRGATRADLRYMEWGAALSAIGGTTFGFSPRWGFVTSPDGRSGTAWRPLARYTLNQYVSRGGNWYRALRPGTSDFAGPQGRGRDIPDGSVRWTFAAHGGAGALLDEPGELDYARLGAFLNAIAWHELVPSGLDGMPTLVVSGNGTYTDWTDRGSEVGGMDWIVSAASKDGELLVAYVPDGHRGAFAVDLRTMRLPARARWYDPANGRFVAGAATASEVITASSSEEFEVPGINSGGATDWVLLIQGER